MREPVCSRREGRPVSDRFSLLRGNVRLRRMTCSGLRNSSKHCTGWKPVPTKKERLLAGLTGQSQRDSFGGEFQLLAGACERKGSPAPGKKPLIVKNKSGLGVIRPVQDRDTGGHSVVRRCYPCKSITSSEFNDRGDGGNNRLHVGDRDDPKFVSEAFRIHTP